MPTRPFPNAHRAWRYLKHNQTLYQVANYQRRYVLGFDIDSTGKPVTTLAEKTADGGLLLVQPPAWREWARTMSAGCY